MVMTRVSATGSNMSRGSAILPLREREGLVYAKNYCRLKVKGVEHRPSLQKSSGFAVQLATCMLYYVQHL